MREGRKSSRWYPAAKRILDWLLAGTALLLLSPAFVIISLLVRLSSPGPILFRQKRLGHNGNVFTIFKFRTMRVHEAKSIADKITHSVDPRITFIGRFLRNFHLDELPQLLNVLRGEMSIVGPRPLMPDLFAYYSENDKQRLKARPGITGWQQVNGGANHTWAERISLDVWYVDNASMWLDLKIICRTIRVAFAQQGVYARDGSQLSAVPEVLIPALSQSPERQTPDQ